MYYKKSLYRNYIYIRMLKMGYCKDLFLFKFTLKRRIFINNGKIGYFRFLIFNFIKYQLESDFVKETGKTESSMMSVIKLSVFSYRNNKNDIYPYYSVKANYKCDLEKKIWEQF
ncbi:hypothetical protein EDEG_00161 [Edhazardia aedis USNM 41457]|uniref:Uncharacterized protein n=1 Tax=Edhazardia aedis (strain USNM 41457) TaxID=1003232 RepID=J9DR19_EDHAE|nr:hypothetical protein EDEG_00161 [Edhazardia aedis USNM 41457]|eukprot:EJW03782.1 hypothetical protein EDEG_00161 [Edhazardia aedis USNM 41457]